jgi:hypothetical protein
VPARLQYISAAHDSIEAVATDGTIWSVSLVTGIERGVSIRATATAFAVSPRRTTMAVGSEGGELFLIDHQFRVAVRRFGHGAHGRITCAVFEDEATLLVCLSDGQIMRTLLTSEITD